MAPTLNEDQHVYLQVAGILRNQIHYGQIDGKLPSIRELAREYAINLKTANKAVDVLVQEGVAKRIRGKGTFVVVPASNRPAVTVIGVILSDVLNPNFARLAEAIQHQAFRRGMSVLVSTNGRSAERLESILRMFAAHNVQALVVQGGAIRPPACRNVLETVQIPIVGDHTHMAGIDDVWLDVRAGAQMAVEHLIERFGGAIGYVSGSDEPVAQTGRFQGFRDALFSHGYDVDYRFVASGPPTYLGGWNGARAIMNNEDRPRAVFLYNLVMAMGANSALKSLGVRIPDDVAVAGCDDSVDESEMIVPTTTVAFSYAEEARQILQLVERRLANRDAEPLSIRIPPSLVARTSTGSSS